jgi:small subunit ribosomal protein S4
MGDPKKLKKKYSTPRHPWNKTDIDENNVLKREYGLRNRREILVANSFMKKYKDIAKRLIADETAQGVKEKKQMLEKLQRLGLLTASSILDEVLDLGLKDILERRLQSVVFKKGLARSMKQSRQFITHRHIAVGNKEITAPSYLISTEEENMLCFKGNSALSDEGHPERATAVPEEKEVKEDKKEKVKSESKTPKKETKKETKETKDDKKTAEVKEEPKKEEKVEPKATKEEVKAESESKTPEEKPQKEEKVEEVKEEKKVEEEKKE